MQRCFRTLLITKSQLLKLAIWMAELENFRSSRWCWTGANQSVEWLQGCGEYRVQEVGAYCIQPNFLLQGRILAIWILRGYYFYPNHSCGNSFHFSLCLCERQGGWQSRENSFAILSCSELHPLTFMALPTVKCGFATISWGPAWTGRPPQEKVPYLGLIVYMSCTLLH